MQIHRFALVAALIGFLGLSYANAAVRYVNVNNATPTPPYTNWSTAATVIQDAVDAAMPGDEIVVTNGVYATGGRAVHEGMTNRVAVTKLLGLRSVDGPEVTVIRGYQVPGTTNGDSAVRCVYLTNGATLSGFTLTGGAVKGRVPLDASGLPAWSWPLGGHELLSGGGVWCESVNALVTDCLVKGNSAVYGGGSFSGTLTDCFLTENIAIAGGGADRGNLVRCGLWGNSAEKGGGAYYATLTYCNINFNNAQIGGGVTMCVANNCGVERNLAQSGGGSYNSDLYNCIVSGNNAISGGGSFGGKLNNCNVIGNQATFQGGGVWSWPGSNRLFGCETIGCGPAPEACRCDGDGTAFVVNCIVYWNSAPTGSDHWGFSEAAFPGNLYGGALNYSCTTPSPTNSVGNITNHPALARGFLPEPDSPCINAGKNAYVTNSTDLGGNPRIAGGTVDMGAYEFQSPQSALAYAWLQQYGLPTDGSADFTDLDGDGHNNWQEWRAWTDPTNSLSALRLLTPSTGTNGLLLRWQSVSGQTYFLERSTHLGAPPSFAPFASNLVGQTGATVYTDTNAVGAGSFFYRIGVNE